MLIAFNGTGNKDEDNNDFDSNVIKIKEAYLGNTFYQDGVGLGSWWEKIFGGFTGWGGKSKVKKAIAYVVNKAKTSPPIMGNSDNVMVIDVVGFSRGAALAVDFCNELSKLGFRVRCLMLFDTVGSFGMPGNNINMNYDLSTPINCRKIFHAMSINEVRKLFPLTRFDGAEECWFTGYHSDIGGGNGNVERNMISLTWMCEKAISTGLSLNPKLVKEYSKAINFMSEIKKPFDLIESSNCKSRVILEDDCVFDAA